MIRALVDDRIEVIAGPLLLGELERVLRRPKLQRYVDEQAARELVERVRLHVTVVDDPSEQPPVTRDPGDDYLVALARSAGVDAIISGDRDLIDAGLSTPAVWTARELVDRTRAG